MPVPKKRFAMSSTLRWQRSYVWTAEVDEQLLSCEGCAPLQQNCKRFDRVVVKSLPWQWALLRVARGNKESCKRRSTKRERRVFLFSSGRKKGKTKVQGVTTTFSVLVSCWRSITASVPVKRFLPFVSHKGCTVSIKLKPVRHRLSIFFNGNSIRKAPNHCPYAQGCSLHNIWRQVDPFQC